jgi:hypothetical protein
MAQDKKHIQELHEEIKTWKSSVELIRIETVTLNKQLGVVASENSAQEVLAKVEHFQNQFIRQNEVSDELLHEVKLLDHHLATLVSANEVASDHRLIDDNPMLRDKIETNARLFADLRNEFNLFAVEWK